MLGRIGLGVLPARPSAPASFDGRPGGGALEIPAQPLFLATKFVIVMYGSRGYLVYVPRAPAAIRGGEDIRRAAVPMRDFSSALLAAQRIKAQRALDHARRALPGN